MDRSWFNRAIPDVYDEIFNYAKVYIKEKSIYSPTILKDTPPSKKFPLILIKQIRDDLYNENLDKTDQRFNIAYEIEIYSIDKSETSKQVIVNELKKLINDVFDEHYGMNRKSNQQIPNVDTDVYRWNMRFEAKIDENKRIYRR